MVEVDDRTAQFHLQSLAIQIHDRIEAGTDVRFVVAYLGRTDRATGLPVLTVRFHQRLEILGREPCYASYAVASLRCLAQQSQSVYVRI